jgi:hypothetical protein
MTVSHERAAMQATAVENADLVVETDHNEIDTGDLGMRRYAVLELVELAYC